MSPINPHRLHRLSGILIALFVGLHLVNHLASLFGPGAHIELMEQLRMVYRHVLAESLLLTAVVIQIISGTRLFLAKRRTAAGFYEQLQIRSGLYLAFFFLIHVGAVMTGRYVLQLDTNFYFGAAGLNVFPFNLFFLPYYGLAILSFFGHLAALHYRIRKRATQAKLILGLGAVIAVAVLYGMTGGFSGVDIPEAYRVLVGG